MTKLNEELKKVMLDYHNQGMPLIPLNGKISKIKKWQNTTLASFDIIQFENCQSVGMVIPKGILVIDVDNHGNDNGTKSLEKLSKDLDYDFIDNAGMVVRTANNGLHLYYKIPSDQKIKETFKKYPGIEFKTKGRYVVIPESRLLDGKKYSYDILKNKGWIDVIDLPSNITSIIIKGLDQLEFGACEILNHPTDIEYFKSYISGYGEIIEGERNNTVFIIAAEGKNRSISQEIILECIENSEVFHPPLKTSELKTTIESAFKNQEIEIGSKSIIENFGEDFVFDNRFMPESVRTFVNDSSKRLQCPKDFIFAGLVVTLSSLAATSFKVQVAQHDYEQVITPNLWGMIVGDPSIRKSTALKKSVDLLKPLENEASRLFEQEMEIYNLQNEQNKDSKNTKIVYPKPILERFIMNDPTVEKVGDILSESPNSKLIFRDELIGFLEGLEKDKNKSDKSFFLESWNGNSTFRVDRIQRGSIVINDLCLSLLGTIQPKTLSNYFSKFFNGIVNDGFIQRFQVLVYPDTSNHIFKIADVAPDPKAIERVDKIVQDLYSGKVLAGLNHNKSDGKYRFRFSQEAQFIYNKWFVNLMNVEVRKEESDALGQHLAKYSKLVPSLALIFHLIDIIESGSKEYISKDSLEMAISYSKYLKAHAKKFYSYGDNKRNEDYKPTLTLLNKIKNEQLEKEFFIRDIMRKGWAGLKDKQTISNILNNLEKDGFIISRNTAKSTSYKANFSLNNFPTDTTDRTDT